MVINLFEGLIEIGSPKIILFLSEGHSKSLLPLLKLSLQVMIGIVESEQHDSGGN